MHAFAAGSGREVSALRGMRVAVFGAGGVARATVYGLVRAGADVTVFNRTRDRGEALVDDLQQWGPVVFAGGFDAFEASDFAGLVNCTSLGMLGGPNTEEACIADATNLPEAFIVMDTVYAPRRTPLLRIAESQGAVVVEGIEMFRMQAESQFASWAENPAPAGLFSSLLVEDKSEPV